MSFVRIAASVAIFTLLSAACAVAKPIAVSTDTNLRKATGTNSEVLTLIRRGPRSRSANAAMAGAKRR